MSSQCILVHAGARDHYQVAKALNDSNLLGKLVTDFYPPEFFRSGRPFVRQLPFSKVHQSPIALYYLLRMKLAKSSSLNLKKDLALSRAAFELVKKNNMPLFAYSYYAYDAFKKLSASGLQNKKLLFQLHPHPLSVKKVLSGELDRIPFARESILYENEFHYSEEYLHQLGGEPALADAIVAASTYTKNTLIENGVPANKITVIPYGISMEQYADHPATRDHNGKLRIIFVGSMVQRKGLSDLLEALALIKSNQVELILCGRGFMDQALIDQYKDERVTIKYNLSSNELIDEMRKSNLFVLPSLAEGFAHVILEAMAAGLPVITTANTCGPDIITDGKNGFIVEIKNASALAEKIEWCMSKRSILLEMGKNAEATASNYSWENFREGIVSFYENAISA